MDLLLLALLLALGVWGFRKLRGTLENASRRRARASMPGSSPDRPLVLSSRSVLEEAQQTARCGCGGRVLQPGRDESFRTPRGEGTMCGM